MTVLNDTWRFLVQRKLWPLALALVAAAAAVPMLLSKEPEAPAPAVAAVKADDSALATQPIVALASEGDRAERRRVLGSRKDPFEPNATPTPVPTPAAATAPTSAQGSPAATATTSGGTGSPVTTPGPSGSTPASPGFTTPLAPVTSTKEYELFDVAVRFASTKDARQPREDVRRLEALPSSDAPAVIYLGMLKDRKIAVFVVGSGLVAQGDGVCRPSRAACESVHLKMGETETFTAPAAETPVGEVPAAPVQYKLEVVQIRKTVTTSAEQAYRSLTRVSEAGREILVARILRDGPLRYRYDERSGRLEMLSAKEYQALVARAAKLASIRF